MGMITGSLLLASAFMFYQRIQRERVANAINSENQKTNQSLQRFPTKIRDDEKMCCLVCMTNLCNVVIVPCNHLAICKDCFDEMRKRYKDGSSSNLNCPCCRVPMDENQSILVNYKPLAEPEKVEEVADNDVAHDGPGVDVLMSNNDQ